MGPTVLEQWSAAIATPSLQAAHMDCRASQHWDAQKVWLSHAKAGEGLMKASAGPRGTMAWALQELQLHQQAEWEGVPRETVN